MSVVKEVTNRVEYTAAGKPVPILLAAPKVLVKTFSLSFGDYSNGEIFSTGKHLKNEHPIRTYFNYSFKINEKFYLAKLEKHCAGYVIKRANVIRRHLETY